MVARYDYAYSYDKANVIRASFRCYTAEMACEMTFVSSVVGSEHSGRNETGQDIRCSLISSCTTLDAIWLSGFGGTSTTSVEESNFHPSLAMYSSNSAPAL